MAAARKKLVSQFQPQPAGTTAMRGAFLRYRSLLADVLGSIEEVTGSAVHNRKRFAGFGAEQ
jgi:hypothetical protein